MGKVKVGFNSKRRQKPLEVVIDDKETKKVL